MNFDHLHHFGTSVEKIAGCRHLVIKYEQGSAFIPKSKKMSVFSALKRAKDNLCETCINLNNHTCPFETEWINSQYNIFRSKSKPKCSVCGSSPFLFHHHLFAAKANPYMDMNCQIAMKNGILEQWIMKINPQKVSIWSFFEIAFGGLFLGLQLFSLITNSIALIISMIALFIATFGLSVFLFIKKKADIKNRLKIFKQKTNYSDFNCKKYSRKDFTALYLAELNIDYRH